MKNCFKEGKIPPAFIAESLVHYQEETQIGAHQIFLGQVRNDRIDGNEVVAIEYSANEELASKVFNDIKNMAFEKFDLMSAQIFHSIGRVNKGEICLFVCVSSKRRKVVMEAIAFIVEEIKAKVPVFGKELFADESHVWKENR